MKSKLSSYLNNIEPEGSLEKRIIDSIKERENNLMKMKTWSFGMGSLISFVLVFYSGFFLYNSFTQSGFYHYFSLIFSGDTVVLSYWKELLLSLAESVPILSISMLLITLTALVWSGANTITNFKRFSLTIST
jgi:hypothetical protein